MPADDFPGFTGERASLTRSGAESPAQAEGLPHIQPYCTATVMPLWLAAVPTVITTGCGPGVRPAGI